MELSLSSATSRAHTYNSSPELFLLEKAKFPTWDCYFPSPSRARRIAKPLFAQPGALSAKHNPVKVVCCLKREATVVEGRSMHEIYDALAARLVPTAAAIGNPKLKYIVGLAGSPGSGKSTTASEVVRRVNKLWPQKASALDSQVTPPEVAAVLPMDGFHLYLSQLDAMENPEEAHARRGAPWTFNPKQLLESLKTLRSEGSVYAPSFDHGVGDPVEDDIFVTLQHKVVIVEGNYLLLDDGIWKEVSSMFDEKWFLEVDIDKAMERVRNRHILTGKPPDVAKWRVEYNDRPNAVTVNKSKRNADLIIKSIDY
ncbi:putative uridine kinase C227.14 isoform X2 [Pyrus x bretschneideri]|uniref:putative uridine kinase C227.14 isoform X2 n=1 Tax=Pyrus x bretschneideri TaxID=225117 RepID=UPI000510B631|nr:putative uridine kinase C227.14 isoform X2 [Pyrus x bretschneideri]